MLSFKEYLAVVAVLTALGLCVWAGVSYAATPNTVDVNMKAHVLHGARYPTAIVKMTVRNNTANDFLIVGHIRSIEDGVSNVPIGTFPFPFDYGAQGKDRQWDMALGSNQTLPLKFKVRLTAKKRYCLKVRLDVSYIDAPKGGSAQASTCIKVRS